MFGRKAVIAEMFEIPQLLGQPPEGIPLATRKKTPIPNAQAADPDYRAIQLDKLRLKQHKDWKLRKPISGLYNCYGHVWASRRTAIYDNFIIDIILHEDGYRKIQDDEPLQWGDLILYYCSVSRHLLHVGVVQEFESLYVANTSMVGKPVPRILSKWNDSSSEVLHHEKDVPWKESDYSYIFWTDRPIVKK